MTSVIEVSVFMLSVDMLIVVAPTSLLRESWRANQLTIRKLDSSTFLKNITKKFTKKPWVCNLKLFTVVLLPCHNKLECLPLSTRSLYYKTLRILKLRKKDKVRNKLASSGMDKHTSLDKQTD
jgi:hypothetical protein